MIKKMFFLMSLMVAVTISTASGQEVQNATLTTKTEITTALKSNKTDPIASKLIAAESVIESSESITPPDSILVSEVKENSQKIESLSKKLSWLNGFKISGYIQAQWQIGQGKGQPGQFTGGNFPSASDNRFSIRRGRLKVQYTKGIASAVIQIDATEKGLSLKDAYINLASKSGVIGMRAGMFDRPFGYEISYSSSIRETPERSRMFQTLFPNERDMGAKIMLQGKENTFWRAMTLNAGVFTGNGTAAETDSRKDFIARLGYEKKFSNISFGLGASTYIGGVLNTQNVGYTFDKATKSFVTSENVQDSYSQRNYYGADAQFSTIWSGGVTSLRGEFVAGRQPGSEKGDMSPKGEITAPVYNRKFVGYSLYLIQDIARTKLQGVARLDYWDPNRQISGDEIGVAGTDTGVGDIAYTTLGVGAVYNINKAFKVMAYYDIVWNEKSSNLYSTDRYKDFTTNIKDNVFTLRFQAKF